MPKIETNDNSLELKIYLRQLLNDNKIDGILDNIIDKDIDKLWKFVVGYKLLAHNLEKLRIDDVELAYLSGRFLGNYHAIERLLKLYDEKNMFDNNIDEVIGNNAYAIDILSDLYVAPAISEMGIISKYKDEDVNNLLNEMKDKKIISKHESEKERIYMLTKNARKYMKERYFISIEEEKQEEYSFDNMRSKALHLLREENKKESE
ncbi:MAG: hypothetical protein J6O56_04930 [Bacilli bacterium]|nr:hypothetical protein [Bacilli bacterium]